MSPKQDHVVFGSLLVVADRAEHVGQRVEFGGRAVRADVDVDRREGERLGLGQSAHAERGHQRRPADAARRVDRVQRAAVDLQGRLVEEERAVLVVGVASGGHGGEVVVPAGGRVDLLDQADDHPAARPAQALAGRSTRNAAAP